MSDTPRSRPGELMPFSGDASVRVEGVDLAWTVPVIAISSDALLVRAPAPSASGALVHLELTTGSELVHGMGEVASVRASAHAEDSHELLIRFLFLDEPSRGVLRRLVERAGTGSAAPRPEAGGGSASGVQGTELEIVREALVDETADRSPAAPRAETSSGNPEAGAAADRGNGGTRADEGPGEQGWVLDPIDPEEVSGVELSALEPPGDDRDAVSATPREGAPGERNDPLPRPAGATTAPAAAAAGSASAAPAVGPGTSEAAFASVEGEPRLQPPARGRSWTGVGVAAVLLALFLAAAWWTRDAWLDGAAPAPLELDASAADGVRPGRPGPAPPSAGPVPSAVEPTPGEPTAGWRPVPTGASELDPADSAVAAPAALAADASRSDTSAPDPGRALTEDPAGADDRDAAATSPPGPAAVLGVEASETGGETAVVVSLSRPLAAGDLSSFALPDPPRFVVRLRGVATERRWEAATALLTRIRTGIHPGEGGRTETHLVFDLAADRVEGGVSLSGDRLVVRLRPGDDR